MKPIKLKNAKLIGRSIIKNIRNLFKFKKLNKTTKDRIIRGITTFFEEQEEDHYKLVRVGNFETIIILNVKVVVNFQ